MDSGGPATLIQTYTTVTHQGGALALLHVTDRLPDLLVITKLAHGVELLRQRGGRTGRRRGEGVGTT